MHVFPYIGFSRARLFGIRLLSIATMVFVVLASASLNPRPVTAQMEYDFNGDESVTCADFREEYPDTFTDEATAALQQYPDELSDLNNDPEEDDLACEGQPESESRPDSAPPRETPAPEPEAPAPEPEPEPEAEPSAPNPAEEAELPADVMARVEGCAVVSVSPHSLVGAGCPGVGVVTYHVPDGAPLLEGTVIMNPGAAQTAIADRAPQSTAANGGNGSAQNQDSAQRAQDTAEGGNGKNRATKQQSADDTKADKGKGKKQDRDGKKRNKSKNKDGNNNKDKKGKKDKKQRRR